MFKLLSHEKYSAFLLSLIFAVRMLGLFMILPVFGLYAGKFHGATPFLIGVVLGIYGFSSGFCQILLGLLSDIWGRKKVITLALLIFVLGSFLAAKASGSSNIYLLIMGRFLQGAGASGSAVLALMADLTQPESRTKAMALIGMMIGISFVVAMILGPVINGWFGLLGIFYLTAILGLLAIVILWLLVPNPVISDFHEDQQFRFSAFKSVISDLNLWVLNLGIFLLHAILVGVFVALPSRLSAYTNFNSDSIDFLYLVTLIFAFFSMIPFIIFAEKRAKIKETALLSIGLLILGILIFLSRSLPFWMMGVGIWIFFTGFIFLEATLPSWLSKICLLQARGTSFGVYSSCQFFGAFFGGTVSGIFLGKYSYFGVFVFVLVLALFWMMIKVTIKSPPRYLTRMLSIPMVNLENSKQLMAALKLIPGVVDVQLGVREKTAYLRLDPTVQVSPINQSDQANQKDHFNQSGNRCRNARKFDENIFNQSTQEVLKQWQKGH